MKRNSICLLLTIAPGATIDELQLAAVLLVRLDIDVERIQIVLGDPGDLFAGAQDVLRRERSQSVPLRVAA